jgi:hypothetical protein
LAIDTIDNLFDEYLLRIIEGMSGADKLQHYEFIDSRIREANNLKFLKVNYIRYMAGIQAKMKHLERISRKILTLKILEEREQTEKLRKEEVEARKKSRLESKATTLSTSLYLSLPLSSAIRNSDLCHPPSL